MLLVSRDTGKPKKFGALNLSYDSILNIYFRRSGFKFSLLLIHYRYAGEYLFRLHQTETHNLSDMWRSTFEIGRRSSLHYSNRIEIIVPVWTEALSRMVFVPAQAID